MVESVEVFDGEPAQEHYDDGDDDPPREHFISTHSDVSMVDLEKWDADGSLLQEVELSVVFGNDKEGQQLSLMPNPEAVVSVSPTELPGTETSSFMRKVHPSGRRKPSGNFHCSMCNASFMRKANLARHNMKHNDQLLKCDQCDRTFYEKHVMTAHKRSVHDGIMFICGMCGKTYKTKIGLKRHESIHTGTEKYRCHLCEAKFAYSHMFADHMNQHQSIKHGCDKCSRKFNRKRDLDFHRSICGNSASIACAVCNRMFKAYKYLKAHMSIHSGGEQYQCSMCSQMYHHRGSLSNHMKRHHP